MTHSITFKNFNFKLFTTDINFQFVLNPFVKFNAKWDIEPNYDFIRFQALIADSGWITLSGEYTEAGSGQPAQPFGEHGYDDLQEDWVEETIHLDYLDGIDIEHLNVNKKDKQTFSIEHAWASDYDKDTCKTYQKNIRRKK